MAHVSEALRRLWHRDRGNALILSANVASAALLALVLLIGLPTAGVYAVAAGGVPRILLGVVITLSGPFLASRFQKFIAPRLRTIAWLLADASVSRDVDNVARLTRNERETVDALIRSVRQVRDAAQVTTTDGKWDRLERLRSDWLQKVRPTQAGLSRNNNVTGRLEMIETLLIDGSQNQGDAATFAELLVVIADETAAALASLASGHAVAQGGTTWPAYYEQGRKDDLLGHGGRLSRPVEKWTTHAG